MNRIAFSAAFVVCLVATPSFAALVLTQNDSGVPAVYSNGGGTGFGGTLGNGAITMDVVGSNLNITFVPGNSLNDIVALFLDTQSGGVSDADMNDTQDGGRRALSNLTANDNDLYPVNNVPRMLPDYGVTFGNFGTVLFQLVPGNNLQFMDFTSNVGSITIPLVNIGNPAGIDFFAGYVGDSGYNSNESLPFSPSLNSAGNPGFGDGSQTHEYVNFNRFITTAAPEASTICIWGLILVSGTVARRRFAKAA